MSKTLWLVAGIPGIGKSTWLMKHKDSFAGSTEIISRDKIRFTLLRENDDYFSKENAVWTEYVNQAAASLKYNENTILDATHLNEASRRKILFALKDSLEEVEINIIVFTGTIETAIKRNDMREGRAYVPVSTIRRMNSQMTLPTLEEGFKKIFIVDVDNTDRIIEKVGE